MAESSYEVTDRRPIAARKLGIFQRFAERLARAGVSANSISVAGAIAGIAGGIVLALTRETPQPQVRALWLAGAAFVQIRLTANLLDGMVAISSRKASAIGELFNEIPDRISDPATLIGLGYAAGASPVLGWLAALLAVLTAYVRMVGKSAGAGSDFSGPMAKQHRMFVVTVLCLFCGLSRQSWQQWRPVDVALLVIIVGSFLTACRRLLHIAAKLKGTA
jgi:phosphatidylglycerophosphate synthase